MYLSGSLLHPRRLTTWSVAQQTELVGSDRDLSSGLSGRLSLTRLKRQQPSHPLPPQSHQFRGCCKSLELRRRGNAFEAQRFLWHDWNRQTSFLVCFSFFACF